MSMGHIFGLFWTPNMVNIRTTECFLSNLQNLSTGFTKNLFLSSLGLLLKVCGLRPTGSIFLGPFRSRKGRNYVKSQFLAATKQLDKWYFPSVRLSVRLSVTPFWLCSHHRNIMKFSGVITNDQRKVHAKGQGQRSKVKVPEVTTPLNRFQSVTPVWIHIWWWNDTYSLMLLRRGALLCFKVIRQISRSYGSKNLRIWPRLGVSGL